MLLYLHQCGFPIDVIWVFWWTICDCLLPMSVNSHLLVCLFSHFPTINTHCRYFFYYIWSGKTRVRDVGLGRGVVSPFYTHILVSPCYCDYFVMITIICFDCQTYISLLLLMIWTYLSFLRLCYHLYWVWLTDRSSSQFITFG